MTTLLQQVRWDAPALAIVDAVLAERMAPADSLREMARRLGVQFVTDNQLRNAFARNGRRFSWRAGLYAEPGRQEARDVGTSAQVPTHGLPRGTSAAIPTSDTEPPTHRSERVPTTQPPAPSGRVEVVETACRAFVAPRLRVAIVGHDPHVPRQSPVWQDLFFQVAVGAEADTVFLNGDVIDGEALGSYSKRPKKTIAFEDEIAATNDFLDGIDALGIKHRHWIGGNHCDGRFDRYIADRAPAFDGLVSLDSLLRLTERGWHKTDYKDHIYFGSCLLSHELGRGGRHAAARTKEDAHCDISIGHTHRFSTEWRADVMGKVIFGATFGWGADVSAAHYTYKAHVAATHVLGFGLLTLDEETGQTFVEPVPIVNGRCVARGKLYVSRVPVPTVNKRVA